MAATNSRFSVFSAAFDGVHGGHLRQGQLGGGGAGLGDLAEDVAEYVRHIGVAIAAGWAIAGLFQLGNTIALVLMMAFGAVSLYALYEFMKRAVSLEPIRG